MLYVVGTPAVGTPAVGTPANVYGAISADLFLIRWSWSLLCLDNELGLRAVGVSRHYMIRADVFAGDLPDLSEIYG